jgi:hypothetical protein
MVSHIDEANPFTIVGVLLILLGVVFVALPYIDRIIDVDKVPWIILYFYRSDDFTFAISPLLIILSAISLLLAYARR